MNKKILFIAAVVAVVSLTSCGGNNDAQKLAKENEALKAQLSEMQSTAAPTSPPSAYNGDAKFDEYNVLAFTLSKDDRTSYAKEVINTYTVTNNGSYDIKKLIIDVAYYDANNNIICKDSRYNDVLLSPGQSVDIKSYSQTDGEKEKVARSAVISYNYTTVANTPEGYNYFDVNLQTNEASGKSNQ